jgi:hypothetical protein
MIIVSKKFDEDRRRSTRIFEKMQNIPLTQLVGIKYFASKEYSSPDYTEKTNSVKNILLNFDKEISNYWLSDVLPFFYIWYEGNKNKQQLDIENNNEHQMIIIDYLKKIFSSGLYKDNKTWQIIQNQNTIKNSFILKFINKLGESCKNIVNEILLKNEQNYLYYYSRKIMDTDEGILSLFNLDTLHDISRVSFLEDTYNKLFKRNFMRDYKTWLYNNRYLTEEIFTVKQQPNFEKKLLGYLIKNNDTLKKQNDMNREEIVEFIKNNNKGSVDVWTERKTLETDYRLKINNLYTSYFDSNPTNSNYKNNEKDIQNCNILRFNLGSIEVIYKYDNKDSLLEVEFSFSTNHFQNPTKMKTNQREDRSCVVLQDILENYKSYPEFSEYIEKILYKCYYDNENNKFTFRGKKTGPSISMLCAIALLIIDRDKNISSGLKKGDKFSINLAMLIFEEAFMLKRIGDLGQILLANRLGYIFATNDHLQAIISILAGNMTMTTCGTIKFFYLENITRLKNLLSISCEKKENIDKKIGQKRSIVV